MEPKDRKEEAMKANEFMVGDWVDIFPDYCQVLSIGKHNKIHTTTVNGHKVEGNIGLFITEKILCDNGFSHWFDDFDHDDNCWLLDVDETEITLVKVNDVDWTLRMQRGPEKAISLTINYVHELQHAAKLIGLSFWADDLKIKMPWKSE